MDKMMREEWDYSGTPIQLWFIDRDVEKERDEKFGGRKFKNNGNRDKVARKSEPSR
jgi:hypothetical protein